MNGTKYITIIEKTYLGKEVEGTYFLSNNKIYIIINKNIPENKQKHIINRIKQQVDNLLKEMKSHLLIL